MGQKNRGTASAARAHAGTHRKFGQTLVDAARHQRISSIGPLPLRMASSAASWLMMLAHSIEYW